MLLGIPDMKDSAPASSIDKSRVEFVNHAINMLSAARQL